MFDTGGQKEPTAGHGKWAVQKGQALVEFAVLLPILLLLVLGVIEFGRALYIKNTLNNAARQGARVAVVLPWATATTSAEASVRNAISFDRTGLNITTSSSPNSPPQFGKGDTITVQVTLPFTPIAGSFIPQLRIRLVGRASMRYEL